MIVVVDYGMGNLRSAQKGLERAGFDAVISDDPADVGRADGVVLPGVGAFRDCYEGLRDQGFVEPILEAVAARKPLLGICVGMQLLFEASEEGDHETQGLGVLPGRVVRFPDPVETGLKVPHMGWNEIVPVENRPCPVLRNLGPHPYVYFVHSYYPETSDDSIVYATCEYGVRFPAVVGRDRVFATQFHPEKSQVVGIAILKDFGEYVQSVTGSATVKT